jgi:hypothetical protein
MRIKPLLSIGVFSALLVTGAVVSRADNNRHDNDRDQALQLNSKLREIRIGYNIAPVVLNTRGKNPLLIGLGSYIVNAQGGCNDCHTHPNYLPGGDPYAGQPEAINSAQYLSGGRQFGPFTSKNLTPDDSGRPAGLKFEQFKKLLRTGRDPDELDPMTGLPRILQVMPWPVYGNMTDLDLRAIYEYLRAIPKLPNNPSPGP